MISLFSNNAQNYDCTERYQVRAGNEQILFPPTHNRCTILLWAATCTCYFGFLQSREATIPSQSAYDPAVHLSMADVSLDSQTNPKVIAIKIKVSKQIFSVRESPYT